METPTTLFKVLTAGLFISVTLLPAGSLRAAAGPERFDSQASMTDNKTRYNPKKDWGEESEEKHERFALLEWLIREKLMRQHQKMDFSAELDADD